MRFLLEIIFEPTFSDSSYAWHLNRSCLNAINDIKIKCKDSSWYIKGEIKQQFPPLSHKILISIINSKIEDQAFIDMLYKYMKVSLIQEKFLSPILANIYMHPFDEWVKIYSKSSFDKRNKCAKTPEYFKIYRNGRQKVKNKTMRSVLANNSHFKTLYYLRYADDFIIGAKGTKENCKILINQIKEFLSERLNLILNADNTKTTNAQMQSAKFLGYIIYKTKINKMPIRRGKLKGLSQIVLRPMTDAPIKEIIQKLVEKKYAKKNGNPTRNAKFINHVLSDIVNHFRSVERGILNYYSLANNYENLAAKVHYILKYSCVLTIASKMKLKTKKKVFKIYGKDLKILNEEGKIITYYSMIDCKKPKKIL